LKPNISFARAPSALLAGSLLLAAPAFITPAVAQNAAPAASGAQSFDIPAGPLDATLTRIARQSGQVIAVQPEMVQGLRAPAVQGTLSPLEAYRQALTGSGLEAYATGSGAINLRALPAGRTSQPAPPDSGAPQPAVQVRANAEDGAGPEAAYVARRASVGTKTDTSLLEVPQSVSVISSQEIEDKGLSTLTDALAQTPGVSVNPYGFDSRALDWVVLRGFDGWYTSSYRDGLIQNVGPSFLGVQTEVYGLERLEVLRGPSSVLFGKGDVGGVVNRVSKLPRADAPRELSLQLGSFGRQQLAADVGGKIDEEGRVLYRVVGLGLDTGTQEKYPNGERMSQKRQYLAPSLRWQIAPRTSLTLQAETLRDDASDDVQYITGADGGPTRIKEGDPTYSRIKTGSDAAGYRFEHRFDSDWTLRQNLRYARRSSNKHHIQSFLIDDVTLGRQARFDDETLKEFTADTSMQGLVRTGEVAHTLLFGIDWDQSRTSWRQLRDAAPDLDLRNPVYGVYIPEPATLKFDNRLTSTQLGVYAQDQMRIGAHWGVTAGLRQDRVKSGNEDRLAASRTTQTDNATTGRLGINYLVGNGWAPYVSYAESFVPNVGVDADGNTFRASRGRQYEAGVKYIPEGTPMLFTAAVFDLEKTNVVTYDPDANARQIGKVRSRGLELEAKAQLTRQLRLTAAFTSLDMKVLASANQTELGKMPILIPRQTGSLWLDYAVADAGLHGLSFGGGLRYVGKRWNDEGNTSSEPAYALVDAAVRYDTGPWRFALNIANLFDKHYYSGRAFGSYFRGTDRNVMATVKYRF
jgi:iron complex outermembrane receptor protein